MLIDKRFDERIWKAQQEIMNAFSELSADVSNGKLEVCVEEEKLKELYRSKANQAKTMLNSCVDSLEAQYEVVPNEKWVRKIEQDCAMQHIICYQQQDMENKKADFREPCKICKHASACNFDWFRKISNTLPEATVNIKLAHRTIQESEAEKGGENDATSR